MEESEKRRNTTAKHLETEQSSMRHGCMAHCPQCTTHNERKKNERKEELIFEFYSDLMCTKFMCYISYATVHRDERQRERERGRWIEKTEDESRQL